MHVVIADPAWKFGDKLPKSSGGAEKQYSCMSTSDIAALPVDKIGPRGVLALWVPSSMLVDGLTVMNAWGYDLKQTYVWVKTTSKGLAMGMGRLFRNCHEIALIGTKGRVYGDLANRGQRSVELGVNRGHSIKPYGLHDSLAAMFPNAQKIELFARRPYPGWTCLGNEIDGRDLRESIKDLTNGPT